MPLLERPLRAKNGPITFLNRTKHLKKDYSSPPPLPLKGRVHWFSRQAVINNCFLLNPEKKLAQIRLVVFEKKAKAHILVRKMRHRDEGYSNNQLKSC